MEGKCPLSLLVLVNGHCHDQTHIMFKGCQSQSQRWRMKVKEARFYDVVHTSMVLCLVVCTIDLPIATVDPTYLQPFSLFLSPPF